MKFLLAALALLAACGPTPNTPRVSKDPVSIRGWLYDVEGGPSAPFRTAETEAARKQHLFQATYVEVVNAPYVSGGIAENGAFLLLDVPPGKVTVIFSAPGAPAAKMEMDNVPGNADIFVPGVVLKPNGVGFTDPSAVKVRMAARVDKPRASAMSATIAGLRVPVTDTPIAQMADRHDYPIPPTTLVPIAKVK
ncbi:MAG TPA: hypothetical protein VG323_09965 [Thermoanaerobaculia bacterium]|nr:hypothetical protein [Thermoanaerobaculia bacterium]